jgi:hypothetical protein
METKSLTTIRPEDPERDPYLETFKGTTKRASTGELHPSESRHLKLNALLREYWIRNQNETAESIRKHTL